MNPLQSVGGFVVMAGLALVLINPSKIKVGQVSARGIGAIVIIASVFMYGWFFGIAVIPSWDSAASGGITGATVVGSPVSTPSAGQATDCSLG
jgi:hypothetical protein